jgi:DNA-binding transcriptional ArsR family regulator
MLQYHEDLNSVFPALAKPARRVIVQRLSRGAASATDLVGPLDMSLTTVVQHVRALESSGLVKTKKVGRVRMCELNPRVLSFAERWLSQRRMEWEGHLDRLGEVLLAEAKPSAPK